MTAGRRAVKVAGSQHNSAPTPAAHTFDGRPIQPQLPRLANLATVDVVPLAAENVIW